MTPQHLADWRQRMGWTQQQAADALGVGRNTYISMESGRSYNTGRPLVIDRRTALACAALAEGLTPIGEI
ncbi:helix-turn-helix domain-containing protein [Chitiniphilus purpureus]|uniref:Helix-turn-helix domain-containing protein n=1 Tax=Chitiniphilus purpureus TaxID=2981137 RepID=A0ABY6DHQ7_9NEIS|nr:helix-turn-helix transcriptional regulator [Chitiniphilus sp. CD1]UXY13857.1 helix-turn-helix domain-containing protein [Chitiniphilus sp. CD1]